MRRLAVPLLALGFAAPALAADRASSPVTDVAERTADALADPRSGIVAQAVIDAVLNLPVGGLIKAVEPHRRGERLDDDATLGDLASRRDPHFRENMRNRAPLVMDAIAGVVRELARVAPVLEDAADRARGAVERGREEGERRAPRR